MKIDIANIPDELKALPSWVGWKWIDRDGRRTKPPFDPVTGRPGDATDPSLWMTFDRAVSLLDEFDGIGFAVTLSSPYSGVDLDRCLDDAGNLAPWADEIVRRLDSYTERTPSGVGLRVWVRGKLPPGRRREGPVEMYDGGRYFTVTGERWTGTAPEIRDRQEELSLLHARMFPPGTRKAIIPRPSPFPLLLSDEEILHRAKRAKNGERFAALLAGDTSPYNGDDSVADLALCSRLAFWFGGDVDAIDRVFRSSGLMREKWDRQDYRERTIAKSLEGTNFYEPLPTVRLRKKGGNGDGREPGDDDGGRPDDGPFHRTDLGNARRLVAIHGDDLRFCHPWGRWLLWDGDRWRIDETGAVFRRALDVVRQLHAEAAASPDDAIRKATAAWAIASEGERRIHSMISLARHGPEIPILPEQLDLSPWMLNCPNGTVDLRTGLLGPHVRSDFLTRRVAVPFDPYADCPAWKSFLARVMDGDHDLIGFLRRAVGYALTGDISEHVLFFLYGRGRNGKSTFLNTIQYMLGDYAITINADVLTAKNQDEHPTGVADLQGRRFVATIEVEDGRRMAESLVKTLTGGDRIRARRMRQDFYEFDPTHTLFLAANHKPMVRGTDEGIWRRIKLIPFAVQIPEDEIDRSLLARLRAEAAGILAWAVRGCLEWMADGLREPEAVASATAEYRAEMDILAAFLGDRCSTLPGARVKASLLYRAYVDWCKDTGNHQLSMNKFGRLLTERGFQADKSNSIAWRFGLSLQEEPRDETVPY